MWRAAGAIILAMLLAAAAALIALSDMPGFIAGGSDFTATIIGPPLAGQAAAFLLIAVAAVEATFGTTLRLRMLGVMIYVASLLLATHRIDFDPGQGRITDHWLTVTIQVLPMNPADGPAADGTKLRRYWLYDVAVPRQGPNMPLLKGPFPINLDLSKMEQMWGR
jgi:hypothetical protein